MSVDSQAPAAGESRELAPAPPKPPGAAPRSLWPTNRPPWRARITRALDELRFVNEQPPSLADLIAIARRGNWSNTTHGGLRNLAAAHAWIVQAPLLVLGSLLAWSARTAGRVWTVIPVALTVGSALDLIPVVNMFVPTWATWSAWPPLCWIL